MRSRVGVPRSARASLLLLGAALTLTGSRVHGQGRTVSLSVDGRSSDNVSIAADGNLVAVVWSASGTGVTDIFAAVSRDGGASFGAPVRVNATPGEARVSGEMPPRVALVPKGKGDPDVVVVWSAKGERNWRLLVARSTDGARTFGPTSVVPGSDGPGNRGWESVAVDPSGHVVVAWLDHRDMAHDMAKGSAAHGAATHGDAAQDTGASESEQRAALSQLYVATVGGPPPRSIARSVCYCCKTSLATSGRDVFAVWRHVFPGNERDIAMAVSRDGGRRFSAPVRVSADRWKFDGCPDNGPAVAVARDGRVHVVWVTPLDGGDPSQMLLFHASSRDGRSFTPRSRVVTTGLPGHAQLAAENGGALVLSWDEVGGGQRVIRLARLRVDASGGATFDPLRAPESGKGHHPVVASTASGSIVAWVRPAVGGEGSTIGVARVR